MKAARYYGPYDVRIEEVPHPGEPGPDEVLVRVEMAALCGTDASQFTNATMIPLMHPHPISGKQAPLILGHELVGTIAARGSHVSDLAVGQRIVPGAAWFCGQCEACRAGRGNICQEAYLHGVHADGGLAEYARFPARMCVPVPTNCRLEAAVIAQPCAVALHALNRARLLPEQTVALFGVGSIGSLILAAWHASWRALETLPWIAVDVNAARLATAAKLGAAHTIDATRNDPVRQIQQIAGETGVDVAIDATGHPATIEQALASLKRGGRLLQIGIPTEPVRLPLANLVLAEQELITTNGQTCLADLPCALDLLATTNLIDLLEYQVIALEEVVERGLRPLSERRATAKILVRIADGDSHQSIRRADGFQPSSDWRAEPVRSVAGRARAEAYLS